MSARTLVVAHRACPREGAENSLAGIARAHASDADLVEVDVRVTLDGVPVLLHDRTLWRAARRPWPVRLAPARAVCRTRLRGTTETVPSLAAALDALSPGLGLALDVKHPSGVPAVLAAVRASGIAAGIQIWSAHARALRRVARDAPGTPTVLLRDVQSPRALRKFLDDAVDVGARGISAHWSVVSPALLDRAHARGLVVFSWCERLEDHESKAGLDLDGLVTEWPVRARAALDALPARPSVEAHG